MGKLKIQTKNGSIFLHQFFQLPHYQYTQTPILESLLQWTKCGTQAAEAFEILRMVR